MWKKKPKKNGKVYGPFGTGAPEYGELETLSLPVGFQWENIRLVQDYTNAYSKFHGAIKSIYYGKT